MDNQKTSSFLQILIGIVIVLAVFGVIFYLLRNTPLLQKLTSKSPQSNTSVQMSKGTPIDEETKTTRAKLNVSEDTSAWRMYENPKLNFSIKYPQDVTTVTENIQTGQISFPFGTNCHEDICEGVYIGSLDKSENYPPANSSDIEVDGIQGKEVFKNGEGEKDFDQDEVYLLKDNKLYVFDLYTTKEKSADNIKNFNLMLKTFKFLK